MQEIERKKKANTCFSVSLCRGKKTKKKKPLTVQVILNHHLIFNLLLSPMDLQ